MQIFLKIRIGIFITLSENDMYKLNFAEQMDITFLEH